MPLSSQQKLTCLQQIVRHEKTVSQAAKELQVARKTIYVWLQRYQQASTRAKKKALESRYSRGLVHPKTAAAGVQTALKRLVVRFPDWGCRRYSQELQKKGWQLGYAGVNSLLNGWGIANPKERQDYSQQWAGPGRLKTTIKYKAIQDSLDGIEAISRIAKHYGVARKTLYDWKRKYEQGINQGHKGEECLRAHYRKGLNHPRAIYPHIQDQLLDLIIQQPDLSTRKLAKMIGTSSWTICKMLQNHQLNSYQQRLIYAQLHAPQAVTMLPTQTISDTIKTPAGSLPVVSAIPPPVPTYASNFKERSLSFFKTFLISLTASTLVSTAFIYWLSIIVSASTASQQVGLLFATIALTIGGFFFAYSLKYYFTLAIVLSFSRRTAEEGGGLSVKAGFTFGPKGQGSIPNTIKGWLLRLFGEGYGDGSNGNNYSNFINSNDNGSEPTVSGLPAEAASWSAKAGGLLPSLDHITLDRQPFISIHLPLYNEKNVVKRLLEACAALDYHTPDGQPAFEVLVCDDSTDETTTIIQNYLQDYPSNHPQGPTIRLLHREDRSGYKGGALGNALKEADPRTEFVAVFDADFVPYPDTLELFVKYFKVNNTNRVLELESDRVLGNENCPLANVDPSEDYTQSTVAVVGGYQWHVLNKSENWITRGVRTEYAGSYVVERPGQEILGLLKQISGSVYLIRADILRKVGWGTSITEDFQLTLKLYEQGYKVVYTPYVQAPAECASTLRRLIRQRMRWAEGHSHNIKKMFTRLMKSPNLTKPEKLEFLYLAPYYLQAAFFLIGTLSWLISETVFRAKLPFWTSLWGWSLVLTNTLSLPLVNAVGLFMEEAEEKDYLGLLSFVLLSYLLVPFQAYASLKGFLEKDEGTWFRTPKTGRVTDVLTRGRFYRWMAGLIPVKKRLSLATSASSSRPQLDLLNPYLALATANSRFEASPQRVYSFKTKLIFRGLVIFGCFASIALTGYLIRRESLGQNSSFVSFLPSSSKLSLQPAKSTFAYGEKANLTLQIDKQQLGQSSKIIKPVSAYEPANEVEVQVLYGHNQVEMSTKINKQDDDSYGIEIAQPKDFKPGRYTVQATYTDQDQKEHTIEQDFRWGVLAVNTQKSLYRPGETIKFGFGVVDDIGETICDAKLELTIDVPSTQDQYLLTTTNGLIKPSGQCGRQSVTNTADYLAEFKALNAEETYRLRLTAQTYNGQRTMDETVVIKKDILFDIERISYPTRVYPQSVYPVAIAVTADQDFKGTVQESLPADFLAIDISNQGELTDGDLQQPASKQIRWPVNWQKGTTYELEYTVLFPQIAPAFYQVGPLELKGNPSTGSTSSLQASSGLSNFSEIRQWQVAADAPTFVQSKSANCNAVTSCPIAFTNNNAAGNLIIVSMTLNSATLTASVADSQTNTYQTAIGPYTMGTARSYIFYAMNIKVGANTVTVSTSGSTNTKNQIFEYTGLATTNALDQTSTNTNTGATAHNTGAAVTTTQANELLFANFINPTASTWTEGADFTKREFSTRTITEERIVSSTGNYQGTASTNTSVNSIGMLATFSEPVVPENWVILALLSPLLYLGIRRFKK
jgi:cellulose synthase/poly-beta-1,6-N-acetylglucosamine synthase-like glycosyltransferase/transposase-like protein